jgi:nibrin
VKEEREQEREISLKRPRSASESEEDMVDELLPAATAMKRRKLEMEKQGLGRMSRETAMPLPAIKPKKKKEKEIDLRETAKKRHEAEEEAERQERERDEKAFDEIEHVKPANLVVIEEMALRVRTDRPSRAAQDGEMRSDRWDERWNGRKNFKKFRRKGDTNAGPRRNVQNVIVPLVEVKKHSYGIGEQYWDNGDDRESGPKKKKKEADRRGVSQSQSQTKSQPRLRGRVQTRSQLGDDEDEEDQTSPKTTRLQQEASETVGVIDVDSPRKTRLTDKTQSQNARPKKRPASGAGAGVTKRQKTIQTRPASDESDSDDLKFRFGRRNQA